MRPGRSARCCSAVATGMLVIGALLVPACSSTAPRAPTVPPIGRSMVQPIRGSDVSFEMVFVPEGGFWIGRTEVTWNEYLLFCDFDEKGTVPPLPGGVDGVSRPSKPLPDVTPFDRDWGLGRRPAVGMSRNAAIRYCEWLSRNTGRRYRLPTEAEWVCACGEPPAGAVAAVAWCAENSGEMTHEVGARRPNAIGAFDMLGNLWEYCSDPFGPEEPDRAVLRGGGWNTPAKDTSPAARLGFEADWVLADPNVPPGVWWVPDGNHLGFRVVSDDHRPPH